jgi:hypothetical protein
VEVILQLEVLKSVKNLAVLLGFLLAAGAALGQSIGGSLRGTVQDSSSARIVSATIAVRAPGDATARSVLTDDRGYFRIDDLAPGTYRVTVTAQGFAGAAADVSVKVSSIQEHSRHHRDPASLGRAANWRRRSAKLIDRHSSH